MCFCHYLVHRSLSNSGIWKAPIPFLLKMYMDCGSNINIDIYHDICRDGCPNFLDILISRLRRVPPPAWRHGGREQLGEFRQRDRDLSVFQPVRAGHGSPPGPSGGPGPDKEVLLGGGGQSLPHPPVLQQVQGCPLRRSRTPAILCH